MKRDDINEEGRIEPRRVATPVGLALGLDAEPAL